MLTIIILAPDGTRIEFEAYGIDEAYRGRSHVRVRGRSVRVADNGARSKSADVHEMPDLSSLANHQGALEVRGPGWTLRDATVRLGHLGGPKHVMIDGQL